MSPQAPDTGYMALDPTNSIFASQADLEAHIVATTEVHGIEDAANLLTAANLSSVIETNDATGAPYTLVLADAGKLVQVDDDVTVPPHASIAFPTGSVVSLLNLSASAITITEGAAVTINAVDDDLEVADQYAVVSLWKQATNTWYLLA